MLKKYVYIFKKRYLQDLYVCKILSRSGLLCDCGIFRKTRKLKKIVKDRNPLKRQKFQNLRMWFLDIHYIYMYI